MVFCEKTYGIYSAGTHAILQKRLKMFCGKLYIDFAVRDYKGSARVSLTLHSRYRDCRAGISAFMGWLCGSSGLKLHTHRSTDDRAGNSTLTDWLLVCLCGTRSTDHWAGNQTYWVVPPDRAWMSKSIKRCGHLPLAAEPCQYLSQSPPLDGASQVATKPNLRAHSDPGTLRPQSLPHRQDPQGSIQTP